MLSMCLLFCFVLDIMLCCVWKNKIKIVDKKKKRLKNEEFKHISTEVLVHERAQIKEIILLY